MTGSNSPPDAASTPADHRARTYERPDFPYRCGRERLWSSACGRGPNSDGSCGGISECLPTRSGDRWACNRPLWAGGPCPQGPKPDGNCHTHRPPCRPTSSSRIKRRRMGLYAFLGSIAVVATFFATSPGLIGIDRNLFIPGELTAAHGHLIDGKRCGLCHEGHEREGTALAAAIIEYQDLSIKCSQCHGFGGHGATPHNVQAKPGEQPMRIGCIGCHTEHKGADADISARPDSDCQRCHDDPLLFDDFAGRHGKPHPPFADAFGGLAASGVRFDHAKHLDVHFAKPQHAQKSPKGCIGCHGATAAGSGITIPSFDQGCAACHADQIKDQPLVLLTWPELETMDVPAGIVIDACGMSAQPDLDDADPMSLELPGPIDAFLLDADPDDMASYGVVYQQVASRVAIGGLQPLADLVRMKGGEPVQLLAGLSPETVVRPVCSWLANEEYEGPAALDARGWIAGPLDLRYRPGGHADPVLKAWLSFADRLDQEKGRDGVAADLKAYLFDPETGPGICASCHGDEEEGAPVRWRARPRNGTHTYFSHEPHLALEKAVGKRQCARCHKRVADPSANRAFQAIGLATCQECHGRSGVSDSCRTCHRYHPIALNKS